MLIIVCTLKAPEEETRKTPHQEETPRTGTTNAEDTEVEVVVLPDISLGQPSQVSQHPLSDDGETYDSLLDREKYGLKLKKNGNKNPHAKKPSSTTKKRKKKVDNKPASSEKKRKKKPSPPASDFSQSDFLKAYLKQQDSKLELWKLEMQQNFAMQQQQFQMQMQQMQQMNMFASMSPNMASFSPIKPIQLAKDDNQLDLLAKENETTNKINI